MEDHAQPMTPEGAEGQENQEANAQVDPVPHDMTKDVHTNVMDLIKPAMNASPSINAALYPDTAQQTLAA